MQINDLKKYLGTAKKIAEKFLTPSRKHFFFTSGVTVGSAFLLAMATVAFAAPIILNSIMAIPVAPRTTSSNATAPTLKNRPNFHVLQKEIIARNIFNIDGEYPKDDDQPTEGEAEPQAFADINAPCQPSKIALTLVGTIVFGDPTSSIATFKEKDAEEVDVYRVGEGLIGYDKITIHDILRNKVIINNNGHRECFEIEIIPADRREETSMAQQYDKKKDPGTSMEGGGQENAVVYLQSNWVQAELGNGFEKVISSARLVPNALDDGKVNGWKIFSIRKGSLLDKVGLQDGDVVTQVNETVMDTEHGFALYQAFLDEWDISVRVLRQGTNPTTLKVNIKK